MNGNQEVFRRIEKKYIVDEPTYEKLIKKLEQESGTSVIFKLH